jgi:hypothetical protein
LGQDEASQREEKFLSAILGSAKAFDMDQQNGIP